MTLYIDMNIVNLIQLEAHKIFAATDNGHIMCWTIPSTSEEGEPLQDLLCFKSLKCLLLSLMQLTMESQHILHEYTVVKFHQLAIQKFKKHLKKVEVWDHLVLNYEASIKMVSENLLRV